MSDALAVGSVSMGALSAAGSSLADAVVPTPAEAGEPAAEGSVPAGRPPAALLRAPPSDVLPWPPTEKELLPRPPEPMPFLGGGAVPGGAVPLAVPGGAVPVAISASESAFDSPSLGTWSSPACPSMASS